MIIKLTVAKFIQESQIMNNTVDEAIGGFVAAENEIAANSCLRRDDVTEGSADAQERRVVGSIPTPSATDQAFVEGLARVIGGVPKSHIHVAGQDGCIDACHQCGLDIRNEVHLQLDENAEAKDATRKAQAALLYMQRHVRPLVEALEHYGAQDEHCGIMPTASRSVKALSSLPPVLRGGE